MPDRARAQSTDPAETAPLPLTARQRSTKLILLAARLMFMALVLATPAIVV